MKPKVVYVHPGQLLEVRVCHPDNTTDKAGWEDQTRPQSMLFRVDGPTAISFVDPSITVGLLGAGGKIKSYYQSVPAKAEGGDS